MQIGFGLRVSCKLTNDKIIDFILHREQDLDWIFTPSLDAEAEMPYTESQKVNKLKNKQILECFQIRR